MAYFKRTNLFQRILFSRGTALLIIFFIVFVTYGLVSLVHKSIEASSARKIAETEEAALKQKADTLSSQMSSLQTPEGQESALRDQFAVVKPGEHVVVITDPVQDPADDAAEPPSPTPKNSFWDFLKGLFK